jgi:hypothetical protein
MFCAFEAYTSNALRQNDARTVSLRPTVPVPHRLTSANTFDHTSRCLLKLMAHVATTNEARAVAHHACNAR